MRTCIVIVFIITSFLLKCNLAYLQSYIFFRIRNPLAYEIILPQHMGLKKIIKYYFPN